MRLTTSPEALPGSCYICGSASRGLYLDTGLSVEFHGAMYICVTECLAGMANIAQYLTPKIKERYEKALLGLHADNQQLREKIAHLEEVLNGYRNLDRIDVAGSLAHGLSGVGDSKALTAALREGEQLAEREGITPEPGDEQQLVGIRSVKRIYVDDKPKLPDFGI